MVKGKINNLTDLVKKVYDFAKVEKKEEQNYISCSCEKRKKDSKYCTSKFCTATNVNMLTLIEGIITYDIDKMFECKYRE